MAAVQVSPLHAYHSDVMHAMCSQMVTPRGNHGEIRSDGPLPLAKKVHHERTHFAQSLKEEMARRVKADRVLQDLRSDKSRQQARAREMTRRSKWAKSVISMYPAEAANNKLLYTDATRCSSSPVEV